MATGKGPSRGRQPPTQRHQPIPVVINPATAQRPQSIPAVVTTKGPSHGRQPTTANTQMPQQIPVVTNPDLRPLFTRIFSSIRHSFSQRRPWFELVDRSTFSSPESLSEAASRIRKNYSYFRVNYTAIIVVVFACSLLSHPIPLLFLVGVLAAWLYLYLFRPIDQPVLLYGHTFSDREILGILIICTIFVVFLTGLVALMVSSFLFGLGITCVHGAFRVPQEVFVDEPEASNDGFLSFLVAAAPSIPRV